MMPSRPSRTLDIGIQKMWMKRWFSDFRFRRSKGSFFWEGVLQPRDASPQYHIRIQYRGLKTPVVTVLSPALVPRAKHTYRNGSLCLFYLPDRSWTPGSLIAETIVPWTAVWLYCYEFWLDDPSCWYNEEAPHLGKRSIQEGVWNRTI